MVIDWQMCSRALLTVVLQHLGLIMLHTVVTRYRYKPNDVTVIYGYIRLAALICHHS